MPRTRSVLHSISSRLVAGALVTLAAAVMLAQPSRASVILSCGDEQSNFGLACGLDELGQGGSFVIRDKRFEQWIVSSQDRIIADRIRVDPIDSKHNPGFMLVDTADVWRVTGPGDPVLLSLDFTVIVLDGPLRIKDNDLIVEFGDIVDESGNAQAAVTELVTDAVDNQLALKRVVCGDAACANTTGTDHKDFARQPLIHVLKEIELAAPGEGDIVEIEKITQRFSQTPEPASALLLMIGFAALVTLRGRRVTPLGRRAAR